MEAQTVVSRKEWIAARRALLAQEKELTRAHDRVSAKRRALPWVKVEEPYVFEGPEGRETLADLFGGRSQLIVYHFMFGPGWMEGCTGCSFLADHIDGAKLHLQHHDVSLVAVSRAPWREFQDFKRRMGWRFKWVSSHGGDFNYDYGVSFTKEQVATGMSATTTAPRPWRTTNCMASASSTRTSPARSSTPIPPTRGAPTSCSARTTTSTSRRRAATRPAPWIGCGCTTGMPSVMKIVAAWVGNASRRKHR
jgi:predicted dithiol-disulfide oxidoreductase (DUF899 family)